MWKLFLIMMVTLGSVSAALPPPTASEIAQLDLRPNSYTPDLGVRGPIEIMMPKVVCRRYDGSRGYGTSFRINQNTVVTAYHVIDESRSCSVNGQDISVVLADVGKDYALLHAPTDKKGHFAIDCTAPKPFNWYYAQGWGGGVIQLHRWLSRGRVEQGVMNKRPGWLPYHEFDGLAIPGDSGGPVTDPLTGGVVAIVSANWVGTEDIPFARSLTDTVLCTSGVER